MYNLFPAYEFELDLSCSELVRLHDKICRVMGTFVYLVCVTVASFVVLAYPAVAQGDNSTLPPPTLAKFCKEMATGPASLRNN